MRQGTPQVNDLLDMRAWASAGNHQPDSRLQTRISRRAIPAKSKSFHGDSSLSNNASSYNKLNKNGTIKRQDSPHATKLASILRNRTTCKRRSQIDKMDTSVRSVAAPGTVDESEESLKAPLPQQPASFNISDRPLPSLAEKAIEILGTPLTSCQEEPATTRKPELLQSHAEDSVSKDDASLVDCSSQQQEQEVVPVVDFTAFSEAVVPEDGEFFIPTPQQKDTANHLKDVLSTHGFVYARGLVPSAAVTGAIRAARDIFAPSTNRSILKPREFSTNAGYTGFMKESLNPRRKADTKEVFSIRRNNLRTEPGNDVLDGTPETFSESANATWHACRSAALRALLVFGVALGLDDPATFARSVVPWDTLSTLRYIHYMGSDSSTSSSDPAIIGQRNSSESIACGEHTDLGLVTVLLLEDESPGLQVIRCPDGKWMPAKGRAGTVLLNTGAILSQWCNNKVAATPHRVLITPNDRYSVVFFCHPGAEQSIDPLPQFSEASRNEDPHRPLHVTAGQFVDECIKSALTGNVSTLAKTQWLVDDDSENSEAFEQR